MRSIARLLFLLLSLCSPLQAIQPKEYQNWKREWLSKVSNTRWIQIAKLVMNVEFHAKHGSFDRMAYAYNLLREFGNLPLVLTTKSIDRRWVEEFGFRSLKTHLDDQFNREYQPEQFGKRLMIIRQLDTWHNEMVTSVKDEAMQLLFRVLRRYAFRYFNELEGKRLAESVITQKWITSAKKRMVRALLSAKYKPVSGILLAHAQKIQRECNVKGEILYYQSPIPKTGNFDEIRYVTIMESEDPLPRNFGIYHEMGHIVHNDLLTSNDYRHTMQQRYFQEDLTRIKRYLELGKKSIPPNTFLGNYLGEVINKYKQLWLRPKHPEIYQKMLYLRGKEQRADLYACMMLAKRGLYDTLVSSVYYFGLSDYMVANEANDEHPSDCERALYILGFLADKRVNINALTQNYEKTHQLVKRIHHFGR